MTINSNIAKPYLEGERGETSLVEFAIDTGDAAPTKQGARRIPHAAREEINSQLEKIQTEGVIQPSESLQKVLSRLMTGPEDFVAVYLDDVIMFSQSLEAHLEHQSNKKVFDCLKAANLKLNPKKSKFMRVEVEYLAIGHIVTLQGLKLNKRNLDTIKEFPVPIYKCETSEAISKSDLTPSKVHPELYQDCTTSV